MKVRMSIVILIFALVMTGACNLNINLSQGSGNAITEDRQVSDFDRVELSGIGDVQITQGDGESLQVEAEDNVMQHIKTVVEDGTLKISYESRSVIPTQPIRFIITMEEIRGLDTLGVSNINAERIETDSLEVDISGTGNVTIDELIADSLTVQVSGAGNFNAYGEVDEQNISLTGAGNYNGEDLRSTDAEVTITGVGRVVMWVTDTLDATISGGGSINYYGSPEVTENITGIGGLNPQGDK